MYAKLMNNLDTLKLENMFSYVPNYLSITAKKQVLLLDALVHLTEKEIEHKKEMVSKIQISVVGFHFVKRTNKYAYKFQPSVNRAQI